MKLHTSNPFRPHLAALFASGTIAIMFSSTAQAVDLSYGNSAGPVPFTITATDQARAMGWSTGTFNNNTGDMGIYWRGSASDVTYMHFDLSSLAGETITGDVSLNQTVNTYAGGNQITDGQVSTAAGTWTNGVGDTAPGFNPIVGSPLVTGAFAQGATASWTIDNATFAGFVANPSTFYGLALSGGSGSQAHFYSPATLTGTATSALIKVLGATNWSAAVFSDPTLSISGSSDVTGGNVVVNSGGILSILDAATLDAGNFPGTISNSGTLSFGSSADQILSGAISGGGALVKSGAGMLTLTAANTYSGGTTVSGGRLVLQNNKTGSPNFITDSELEFDLSSGDKQLNGGTISGGGKLIKSGASTLMLGNDGSQQTVSLASGALIDVRGGTLRNEYGQGFWGSNLADLNVEAGATFDIWDVNTRVDAVNGTGTIRKGWYNGNSLTIGVDNGSGNFNGTMNSAGGGGFSLIKEGSGTQTISGSISYDGGTTVNGGRLVLENTITGGRNYTTNAELEFKLTTGNQLIKYGTFSGTGKLIKTGGNELVLGEWDAGQTIAFTGADSVIDVQEGKLAHFGPAAVYAPGITWAGNEAGLTLAAGATFDLNNNSATVDELNGGGTITKGTWDVPVTLTIGVKDGSGTFSGALNQTVGQTLALVKQGSGTQTLSGSCNYGGATTINGGTLALGATTSIANSASVAIGAGATLDTSAQATYAIPSGKPVEFGINGAGSGSSGKIAAAGLDVSNATVTYNITGPLDDAAYVLATYSGTLTGTFSSVPPVGYTLDYAYEGNKIALVQSNDNYLSWAGSQIPPVTGGENGDSDNDGVMNLVEYALVNGGERGVFSANAITFTKRGAPYGSDVTYIIETSETLDSGSWVVEETHGPAMLVTNPTISYTFTPSTPVKKFTRLKVITN